MIPSSPRRQACSNIAAPSYSLVCSERHLSCSCFFECRRRTRMSTGRMLLRRPGYEVDIDAILRACAEHGVAIEINANPHRLDLDWRWHRRALELGCMFSINPDAHSIDELDLTRWGVLVARKGGIPPERVLNSLDLKEITAFLDARRVPRTHDLRRRQSA